jgi:hypothetical protein
MGVVLIVSGLVNGDYGIALLGLGVCVGLGGLLGALSWLGSRTSSESDRLVAADYAALAAVGLIAVVAFVAGVMSL